MFSGGIERDLCHETVKTFLFMLLIEQVLLSDYTVHCIQDLTQKISITKYSNIHDSVIDFEVRAFQKNTLI